MQINLVLCEHTLGSAFVLSPSLLFYVRISLLNMLPPPNTLMFQLQKIKIKTPNWQAVCSPGFAIEVLDRSVRLRPAIEEDQHSELCAAQSSCKRFPTFDRAFRIGKIRKFRRQTTSHKAQNWPIKCLDETSRLSKNCLFTKKFSVRTGTQEDLRIERAFCVENLLQGALQRLQKICLLFTI